MRQDVRRKRREEGSPRHAGRAITASLPGKPAFSLGLIGLTIWVFLSLCGCSGTGRTVILHPPEANVRYSSVLVLEEDSGTFVPAQVSRDFRMALMTYLYDRGPFVHGPELRIVYRITGFPPAGRKTFRGEGRTRDGIRHRGSRVRKLRGKGNRIDPCARGKRELGPCRQGGEGVRMAGRVLRETEFLGGGEGIRRRKGNQRGKT